MRLRTVSTPWNVQGKYGPHGELFFFVLKKEPMVPGELIEFEPCISAETIKACALIGLHMMAEENALRSDSDSSRRHVEVWLPKKSPVRSSNGVEWAGSVDASSLEYYEHNVGNLAVEVVGQNWSSEVIYLSFPRRLGGWAGGTQLPLVNGPFCQDVRDACSESLDFLPSLCAECQRVFWWNCHSSKAAFSP